MMGIATLNPSYVLEAVSKAEVLALRVIAERLEHSESRPFSINLSIPIAA